MSNERPPHDEPVIGAPASPIPGPPAVDDGPIIGATPPRGNVPPLPPPPAPVPDEPEYAPEPEDYPPIYVHPYSAPPPRSPTFFVLLFLGVALMGAFLFLLYTLLQDDGGPGGQAAAAEIGVIIDAPSGDQRFNVGTDGQVAARAQSNEVIDQFVIFVNGQQVNEQPAVPGDLSGEYRAVLTVRFDEIGSYDLVVRAVSESGATQDSPVVTVIAVEPANGQPDFLLGEIIARVNLREGPDETFPVVATLEPNDEVQVTGRTQDNEWVFVDLLGGVWLKRTAVRFSDSIAILPVVDPTPTPGPNPTPEGTPSVSPSPSASPNPDAPDFLPTDAVLVVVNSQMSLAVTVTNKSSVPYVGPLVIAVTGVPVADNQKVFPVDLPGNGSATLNFPLTEMVGNEGANAVVNIDPSNLVEESAEDNNEVEFIVTAPVDSPQVTLTPVILADKIIVTINNTGGALNEPDAFLTLKMVDTLITSLSLQLGTDESVEVTIVRLQGNDPFYELKLSIGPNPSDVIASIGFPNPSATLTPEPTETTTPEPTATDTP
jgi:Bacterial SH3 domain